MVNDKITLNFEIEKGEPIDRYYFSARMRLTDESKNLLREKLGSTIQFDNLDDHFNLNHESFYIYYNKYSEHNGRSELYVRDDNGRYLTSNLPLNHYGFSMELSFDRASIVDYGFYPLYAIYNPNHYDKAKEKVFDDHGELSPIASNVLDNFLSNTNSLTTQEMFLQLQNEAAEKEVKLVREKRQAEEELDQKNEELKEFIEKGEITLFKVVKGNDVGNGRSAVVLQLDEEKIILDSSKYYIADYEDSEFLHCVSPDYDMLLDCENLFFVLNKSFYSDFESGFYSADSTDPYNYAKYSKEPYLSDDQLSEKLSHELEEDSNQIDAEVMFSDQPMNEEVTVKSEVKSRKKRAVDEDNAEDTIGNINETNEITGATRLHSASLSGDLNEVIELVEHNANIDAKDKAGQTPLHHAIKSGNTEIAKYLIDQGANLNSQDIYYEGTDYSCFKTPLHYAIKSGNMEIVEYLVEHGANSNIPDAHNLRPLDYAIKNTALVKYLVDNGADINVRNPIFHFVKLDDLDMVEYLAQHGADLNVKNTSAQTLLHYATELEHTEIAKYLIDHGVGINTRDISSGKSPLHFAMSMKNIEVANYLIEHGADVNVKDSYGLAPLHLAVNLGNQEILEYLIKNNANIDVRDSEGWTPLIHAVRHGQLDKVKYLIKNGADIDILGNEGWTLFEHAEQWIDDRRILKNVIDNDRRYADDDPSHQKRLKDAASWEKTGKDMLDYLKGVTKNTIQEEESNYIDQMQADDSSSYVEDQPALQSNRDGYADMEKSLQEKLHGDEIRKQSNEEAKKDIEVKKVTVENDSSSNKTEKQTKPIEDEQKTVMASVIENNDDEDLNAKDSMGYTALHKAVFSKHFDEVKLLIDKGARVDVQDKHELTPLFYAVMKNDEKMIKFLVETGNVNVNLGKYNNPLGIAISHGYMELAEYLINKGANLDQQDSIGRTLLHKAAEDGNLAAVKFLIDRGARLDVLDKWNDTPLHVAANVKVNEGHTEVVDYLIRNGADINLTHNYTPMHLAIIRGNLDMVKCLIDNNADLYVKRACDGTPLAYAKQQGQIEIVNYMDSIISNLSRSKTISLDKTNINIKYDLAGNKLNIIENSIKNAIQNFKGAFNTSDHDIKINAYIFNTQNDFKEYLKKVGFDAGNGVNGYTKMIDLSKGNAADVYVYLDSKGNLNQHTLEHEIGHAMHFANLGLSYILPKAMHEAIANYVAGLENGRHINDHGDKEALAEIRNKSLKPDEILRNDYQGKHYYSEAEQVVKFLEHKHPDLIDNLLKSLSTYGYHGRPQADKLVEDFLTGLKDYAQEFKEWVKVQLSSKEHSQHKDMEVNQPTIDSNNDNQHSEQQGKSRQKREVVDEDEQEAVMTSVIDGMKDNKEEDYLQHPLKIKAGEAIGIGKYKVELQVTYDDVKNFYDTVRGKYHDGSGYNYEQVMVLYNEIVRPASQHYDEPFTLAESYTTDGHLFIKNQDFGVLNDFNEMFYKSDELI
ncbi:ankyrin repeat protein [Trichonephila inaurata madagascariensis]|uniref:Ankyrin repeat protein n=1 Tax=Trichonephila inaurata madagascariensis TaxID=2747483 RepID=A0A8X6YX01_9ARAC|nr:ankyrin repeat protein [Trichonephila inaurata madagascariensis]